MEKFAVVSPAGWEAVRVVRSVPRLPDLNGRTVAEVWNGVFKGDSVFPLLRKLLKQRYPDIKIVPFTDFYHMAGSDVPAHQRALVEDIVTQARQKGVDAIISGMGA